MRPQVDRLLELKPNDHRALRIRRELKGGGYRASAAPTIRSPRRRRTRKNWLVLGIFGGVAAVLVGMAILLATKMDFEHGTIALNIDNPRTTILIDGIRLAASDLNRPIRLQRGQHSLVVIRDDGKQFKQDFEVKWGRNRPLLIEVGGAGDYRAPLDVEGN
jgi:hypothetical protein